MWYLFRKLWLAPGFWCSRGLPDIAGVQSFLARQSLGVHSLCGTDFPSQSQMLTHPLDPGARVTYQNQLASITLRLRHKRESQILCSRGQLRTCIFSCGCNLIPAANSLQTLSFLGSTPIVGVVPATCRLSNACSCLLRLSVRLLIQPP